MCLDHSFIGFVEDVVIINVAVIDSLTELGDGSFVVVAFFALGSFRLSLVCGHRQTTEWPTTTPGLLQIPTVHNPSDRISLLAVKRLPAR